MSYSPTQLPTQYHRRNRAFQASNTKHFMSFGKWNSGNVRFFIFSGTEFL